MMSQDQVHLHNEFLLCLFCKVQGLSSVTTVRTNKHNNIHTRLDKEKISEKRLRLKRKYKTDKSNFEPADVYVEVLSQTSSPVGDEPIGANHSSAQKLLLPDRTFVLARLMLAAWENNMDGAEENTAHIIIAATQVFLKNLLTAVITRRKGFSVREGSFIHNIGEPVPSSWTRNTSYMNNASSFNSVTNVVEPEGQVPAMKQTLEEAEQATAFALACSAQTTSSTPDPISVANLLQALKVYKNLINNHTIYATNMERLYKYATHSTWEELETRKILYRSSKT
ncbi:transcriptional adapter 1-like isoform X2 [Athalia rosae]|nr:transcriptional adapter 1-like isoform X2 [Athalia rosae]